MNILYYNPDNGSFMSQWQKFHFIDELERHGHNIKVFNPLSFRSFTEANNELISFVRSANSRFDLFMNSTGSDELYPESIGEIKKTGMKSLLISFDNLHAPFMHKSIAPEFDLVWLTSHETKNMFIKWGCNVIFMPYAANPYFFKPSFSEEIPAAGFIGMPYGSRLNKIKQLVKNEIKCQVYYSKPDDSHVSASGINDYRSILNSGFNLLRFDIGRKVLKGAIRNKLFTPDVKTELDGQYFEWKPSVSFEEMSSVYSNLAISLGITELRNTYVLKEPVHKLHLRTFEIPMSGGVQLSPYTDELAGYFEDGKEIILYNDDEEMISKARFYMNEENRPLRQRIRNAARKRAENEHTWFLRFDAAFRLIFENYK
jgi:hypothetical protein